jgi:3-oxoacyl-[acyl-carrier protein] reductase
VVRATRYPELCGRVALVTGGSGALGSVTCELLALNGMKVGVNGRGPDAVAAVVNRIQEQGGEALALAGDCRRPEDIAAIRGQIQKRWGRLDALLAFAGGTAARPAPIVAVGEQEWQTAVDENLTTLFNTLKCLLPMMMERKSGSVVAMSSAGAHAPGAPPAYGAAKAGVIQLARQAAADVARFGIRVNCLSPSSVRNARLLANTTEAERRQLAAAFPLGRIGEPEDVALAALFLISDGAAWITGINLDIAGGRIR